MAAVTICSDFRDPEEEICHCFYLFPLYLPWSNEARCHDLIFLYLVLSWFFPSPPSPSSRGSLVPLCFLPLEWYHPHIWGCWCFSRLSWFQVVTHADRTMYGTVDWFKIEKGVWQGRVLSSCLFNLCAEHIMRNAGLDKLQRDHKCCYTWLLFLLDFIFPCLWHILR